MSISATLQHYLDEHGVPFDLTTHTPTLSSAQTAQACHISGKCIAKGVVVKDPAGYLLAVLPASHHIQFDALEHRLNRHLSMAGEDETHSLFQDCDLGSIPALGDAYGLDVVVDDSLADKPDVYIEGGDHRTLLHLKGKDFGKLMINARHARFSRAS